MRKPFTNAYVCAILELLIKGMSGFDGAGSSLVAGRRASDYVKIGANTINAKTGKSFNFGFASAPMAVAA